MSQVLPKTDTFDAGTTVYGSTPVFYQRFLPWTSAEGATGYGINFRAGDLHTGYYQAPGNLLTPSVGQTNAAVGYGNPASLGVPDDLMCGFLWRQAEATEGTASVWVTLYKLFGTVGLDAWRYCGVCVRASGQTVTDLGTVNERLTAGDSYWFILANKASAGGAEWLLLRVNGGTVTVLDSLAVADIGDLNLSYGRELSLEVADDAGDVLLTARTRVNYGQVGTPLETTIFTYTDSSGSKITSTGRFGFGSSQGRNNAAGSTVQILSNFTAKNASDEVLVRDRFRRPNLLILPTTLQDEIGVSGRSLLTAWGGDWRSNYFAGELVRDSNRVKIDGGLSLYGYFLSNVQYGPTQDRTATFEFPSAGTAPIQTGGLLMRAGANASSSFEFGDLTGLTGYAAYIRYTDASTSWQALLYAYNANDETLIASATIGSLSLDTTWTLRCYIENVGGSSTSDGIPVLTVQLNGTTIPWVSAGLAGIVVESGTNIVYDTRSAAIKVGTMQGLILNASGSAVFVDTWTAADVGDPIDGDDEASIEIGGEADGTTGVLLTKWEYGYRVEYVTEPRVWRYDSGHVYRAAAQSKHRRRWTLEATLGATDIATLRAFWDSHNGAEIPFLWAEPDDRTVVRACFDQDELQDDEVAPGVFQVSVRILELFA